MSAVRRRALSKPAGAPMLGWRRAGRSAVLAQLGLRRAGVVPQGSAPMHICVGPVLGPRMSSTGPYAPGSGLGAQQRITRVDAGDGVGALCAVQAAQVELHILAQEHVAPVTALNLGALELRVGHQRARQVGVCQVGLLKIAWGEREGEAVRRGRGLRGGKGDWFLCACGVGAARSVAQERPARQCRPPARCERDPGLDTALQCCSQPHVLQATHRSPGRRR